MPKWSKNYLRGPVYDDMVTLSRWFKETSMKVTPKKIQFMILDKMTRQHMLNINQIKVEESQKVVLLGLNIDNRLTFKDYVDMLSSTTNY